MVRGKLGVGFLGAGDVSLLHFKAIQANPEAKLVGLWSRSKERSRQRSQEFSCKCYDSPQELVSDPDIGVVFVLTNIETHLAYASMAFQAGKHVLCEKPVGSTIAEVLQMKALADTKGLVCMPGHNMIYEESLRRAQESIANGELGKIVSVYVMYNIYHNDDRAAAYPGVIRQLFTHNLYTMIYLAGRPVSAFAVKSNSNHPQEPQKEDIAMALLELECGALAHLSVSFAADDLSTNPWTFLVKVLGTSGSTSYTYQDWVESKKGIAHGRTYVAYQGSITNEVRHFLDICRHGGSPLSDLHDAVVAQSALEAIETSVQKRTMTSISC